MKIRVEKNLSFLLLLALVLLSGCAAGVNVASKPVVETAPISEEPTVTRFEDGRRGFVLTEVSHLDGDARHDYEQAVTLLKSNDFEPAIEILEKIVVLSPGVTAPYINLAIAYRNIGKLEPAEEHLKTALSLVPAHPVASNEYGLLLRKDGRFAEARNIYEQSVTKFPDYLPVRRNLGILCDLYLNDQECALTQYEVYSAGSSENEQVKLWITELRMRLGR
ncbi:MAG: tetratricopeptide repeat protein [Desulfuromusa sp.]